MKRLVIRSALVSPVALFPGSRNETVERHEYLRTTTPGASIRVLRLLGGMDTLV